MSDTELIYAIDFGTSNSLLAATDGKNVFPPAPLDPEASDPSILRSLLYFPDQDQCFYGQKAISEYCEHQGEGRLIRSIKKYLPSTSFIGSWIDNRVVKLEDLIGYFLLEMRKRANAHYGQEVTKVILGRPAKYSENPMEDKMAEFRMKKAAEIAGFKEIQFLPEPLAAAFELRRGLSSRKNVLVVDLGGGTSDFTVIQIGPEPYKESDLLSLGGVSVAGDKIDGRIMEKKVSPFFGANVKYKVPLGSNIQSMPPSLLSHICSPADIAQLRRSEFMHFFRNVSDWALDPEDKSKMHRLFVLVEDQLGFQLFERIEACKRELSESRIANLNFDYPDIAISLDINRDQFEDLASVCTDKIFKSLDEVLKASGVTAADIDLVYCTGGTAKLPLIQNGLSERFGQEKIMKTNHFHSVIEGLTWRAQELALS